MRKLIPFSDPKNENRYIPLALQQIIPCTGMECMCLELSHMKDHTVVLPQGRPRLGFFQLRGHIKETAEVAMAFNSAMLASRAKPLHNKTARDFDSGRQTKTLSRLFPCQGTRRIKCTPDIVDTMSETSPTFRANAASSNANSRCPRWNLP